MAAAEVQRVSVSVQRKEFTDRVKLAEQAERYEDMLSIVRSVLSGPDSLDFNSDERNLFSVAFKNIIGMKRGSWRIIRAIEENTTEGPGFEHKQQMAKEYREKIKSELVDLANEVLNALDEKLIPANSDTESQVFYIKMKADYSRYLAEVQEGEERERAITNAHKNYEEAFDLSVGKMSPTHPLRLGLVLNYSVFYYELLGDKEKANTLARSAFDGAISQLDTLNEESYKESTLVLQLIRDNLSLWANDNPSENDGDNLIELLEGVAVQEKVPQPEAQVAQDENPAPAPSDQTGAVEQAQPQQ